MAKLPFSYNVDADPTLGEEPIYSEAPQVPQGAGPLSPEDERALYERALIERAQNNRGLGERFYDAAVPDMETLRRYGLAPAYQADPKGGIQPAAGPTLMSGPVQAALDALNSPLGQATIGASPAGMGVSMTAAKPIASVGRRLSSYSPSDLLGMVYRQRGIPRVPGDAYADHVTRMAERAAQSAKGRIAGLDIIRRGQPKSYMPQLPPPEHFGRRIGDPALLWRSAVPSAEGRRSVHRTAMDATQRMQQQATTAQRLKPRLDKAAVARRQGEVAEEVQGTIGRLVQSGQEDGVMDALSLYSAQRQAITGAPARQVNKDIAKALHESGMQIPWHKYQVRNNGSFGKGMNPESGGGILRELRKLRGDLSKAETRRRNAGKAQERAKKTQEREREQIRSSWEFPE